MYFHCPNSNSLNIYLAIFNSTLSERKSSSTMRYINPAPLYYIYSVFFERRIYILTHDVTENPSSGILMIRWDDVSHKKKVIYVNPVHSHSYMFSALLWTAVGALCTAILHLNPSCNTPQTMRFSFHIYLFLKKNCDKSIIWWHKIISEYMHYIQCNYNMKWKITNQSYYPNCQLHMCQ